MRPRFVQIRNPKSGCYVLIDRLFRTILAHSNSEIPFHGIQIKTIGGEHADTKEGRIKEEVRKPLNQLCAPP